MVKRGGRTLGCVRRRRVGGGGEDLLLHWGRGRRRAPQGHRSVSPECRLGSTGLRSSTPKAPAFRSRVKTKGEEQLFVRLLLSLPLSHLSDQPCAALGGTEWVCLTAACAGFTLVCTAHTITHTHVQKHAHNSHRCKTTHTLVHKHAHTRSHMCKNTHTTHTQVQNHTHAHSSTHTHTLIHKHAHTRTHSHTHLKNTVHTHTCKTTHRCTLNTHACTHA